MPNDKNLQKLHTYLQENGYYDGSLNTFKSNMSSSENRKKLHTYMQNNGLYSGNLYSFNEGLGYGNVTERMINSLTQKYASVVNDYPEGTAVGNAVSRLREKYGEQLGLSTDNTRPKMTQSNQGMYAGSAQRTPQQKKADEQRVQRERAARQQAAVQPSAKPTTNNGAAMDVYLPNDRPRTPQQRQMEIENANRAWAQHMGEVEKEDRKFAEEHPIEAELRQAYADKEEIEERLARRRKEVQDAYNPGFLERMSDAEQMSRGASALNPEDTDETYQQLLQAAYQINKRITLLEDMESGQTDSFWHSMGTELMSGDHFDFGKNQMGHAAALQSAKKKADIIARKREAGEQLTDEEAAAEQVLKQTSLNDEAQARYGDRYGKWARAGKMGLVSLSWMYENAAALAPTTTVAKGIVSGTTRLATNALRKEALKGVTKYAVKSLGVAGGTLVGGAIVTNTTSLTHTAADTARNYMGDVHIDEDGNYKFGRYNEKGEFEEGGDSFLGAFLKAERNGITNAGSELVGEFLPGGVLTKGLKWIGGTSAGKKLGLSFIADKVANIGASGWYKGYTKALKATGFHGVPGEVLEEYVGMGMDFVLGGDEWKSLADKKTHVDIILGCATMGALLNAPRMVGTGSQMAQYYRYKHNVSKKDNQAADIFGLDRWNGIRDMIDFATNDEVSDVVTNLLSDPEMTSEQRKAIFDYSVALQRMRGYGLGSQTADGSELTDSEGKPSEEQNDAVSVNENYAAGYNAQESEDMQGIRIKYEEKRKAIEQIADDEMLKRLDEDPIGALAFIRSQETWTDEERQAATDYVNAKTAYDGMIQRVKDDMDTQAASIETQTQQRVQSEEKGGDGMIHPLTLIDGRNVDLIDGQLITDNEGNIDHEKTQDALLVRDQQTGEVTFINADEIESVGEVLNPAEMIETATQASNEEIATNKGNIIDGVLPFREGDQYQVMDENGGVHQVTVKYDNGNGTVQTIIDGREMPFVKEQLQQWADNMARSRVMQHEQQTQAEQAPQEEPTQQTGQAPQEPAQPQAQTPQAEAMPMIGEGENAEPDFAATTPERGAQYIYEESDIPADKADKFVDNKLASAEKALEEAKKKPEPEMGDSIPKYKKAKAEYDAEIANAQAVVDYWNGVKAARAAAMQNVAASMAQTAAQQTAPDGGVQRQTQGAAPVVQQKLEQKPQPRVQKPTQQEAPQQGEPSYNLNDDVVIRTDKGDVKGTVTAEENEDGKIEVETEQPVNGKRVNLYTREELQKMQQPRQEGGETAPAEQEQGESRQKAESKEEKKQAAEPAEEKKEQARKRIKTWTDKGLKIHAVESADEVENKDVFKALRQGSKVYGWYDTKTGEVYLVVTSLATKEDVESQVDKTVMHEYISHKGLRELLGEELFNQLLDQVYHNMSPIERSKWRRYAGVRDMKNGTAKRRAAADEYIAHLAENTDLNPGLWTKFVNWVREFLRKRGIRLKMSNRDLGVLLRESYNNLTGNKNEDAVKRWAATIDKKKVQNEISQETDGAIETGNVRHPVRFSVSSIFEGAGFEAANVDDEGDKTPMTDSDGNVIVRMGDKVFDGKHPIRVRDLGKNPNSALNMMLKDAIELGSITKRRANAIKRKYCEMLNRFLQEGLDDKGGTENLRDKWLWLGETVFRTIATNGDKQYSYSADITRVCKKNEAVIRAISALQQRVGYGVTPAQIMDIYEETNAQGYQVPCPVCYVFSRYIRNGKQASAAINGMRKYADHLPGGENEWTVEEWQAELERLEEEKKANGKMISKANNDVTKLLDEIDKLGLELLKEGTSEERKAELRDQIRELDQRYRAALNVVAQQALTNWIKKFAIHEVNGQMEIWPDAKAPEDMADFEANALDLRRTGETMRKYPAIQRFRKSFGAAAGKEITFESNNELGELVMGVGTANPSESVNWYQMAAEATDEKQRKEYLKKARERLQKSIIYAQQQSLRGGQRMWSWSDNIEALAPDVAINLMQMEILGGALQSYSKQLEGIRLVGAMGGYVNGSLMAKDNGWREVTDDQVEEVDGVLRLKENITETIDEPTTNGVVKRTRVLADKGSSIYEENGKKYVVIYDDIIGIDPFGQEVDGEHKKGLFELNATIDKAGNIIVGMNDIHVKASMADDRIFFIIPWHSSGQSVHMLNAMLGVLGADLTTFKPVDYTKMQEEKDYNKKSEGKYLEVPAMVTEIWERHKNEKKFKCGIPGGVESGKGTVSESQMQYRALRKKIFDGTIDQDPEALEMVLADTFLSQVYKTVKERVDTGKMTSADNGFIYPYEYWDTKSTYKTADVNGARYAEYCRRLGFCPKFSGRWEGGKWSDVGNFIDSKGYWKLLIDRRMYDVNGKFQDLTTIDSREFDPDYVDPTETEKEFKVTQVADEAGVGNIINNVVERETSRTGTMPEVDYSLNMTSAVDAYQKALNGAEEEEVSDSFDADEEAEEEQQGGRTMFSVEEDLNEAKESGVRFKVESLGAPYQGSKGQIANRLMESLPSGKRFVDLFSGGGAMTHAAMLSGKYDSYAMNDTNPAGQELFMQGVRGEWDDYKRKDMTEEEFKAIKGTPEGIVYSHNGQGRNVAKDGGKRAQMHINRVQRLSALKPYADKVEQSNVDYRNVEIKPGDVVYADIPYEKTDQSGYKQGKFDKKAFVEWAQEQDFPVYVSEYTMPEGWTEVASIDVEVRGNKRQEKLFVQDKFAESGLRDDATEEEIEESQVRFSIVTDPKEIERLEKAPKVRRYRAMALIDGKLYPPMSVYVDGKLRQPTEEGVWERSDETPLNLTFEQQEAMALLDAKAGKGDVIIIPDKVRYHKDSTKPYNPKTGQGRGKMQFKLLKDNGDYVWAAYNPYFHTSTSAMNDQFASAWNRPNLVVVEVQIPEEETGGVYKAPFAKNSTGNVDWKSGSVNRQLPKERQRTVTLSRYAKVVGIVDDAKAANEIAEQLKGLDIEIPFNTVTPSLRDELVKLGVKIGKPEKGKAGDAAIPAYEQWKKDRGVFDRTPVDRKDLGNTIRELIDYSKNKDAKMKRIVLSKVTERQLEEYRKKGIKDVNENFVHSIESTALRHDRHKKDNRGQIPLTDEEMANIIEVIENFDNVYKGGKTNTGLWTIIYRKDMGDGMISYVEEIRTGNKSLAYKTAYKKRKQPSSSDELLPNGHPQTSLTTSDNPSSVSKGKDNTNSSTPQENNEEISKNNENSSEARLKVDEAYMSAVESGDMDTAGRMVREAARRAMPDTKAVDKNGEPLVMYRGGEAITKFEPSKADKYAMYGRAFYATTNMEEASAVAKERTGSEDNVQKIYLNVRNPFIEDDIEAFGYPMRTSDEEVRKLCEALSQKGFTDAMFIFEDYMNGKVKSIIGGLSDSNVEGRERVPLGYWGNSDIVQETLKEMGYDGVIGSYTGEYSRAPQVAVFSPNQIKSADPVTRDDAGNVIPLSERFNEGKDDIRFSIDEEGSDEDIFEQADRIAREEVERRRNVATDRDTGIRFSIAGEKGMQYNNEASRNLVVAKTMEGAGEDAKAIWLSTGWEKGKDGRWRFELPDAKPREDKKWFDPKKVKTIGDIVDAPELFAAYPELKEVKLVFKRSKFAGEFVPATNTIELDKSYNTVGFDKDYKLTHRGMSTLLHELQHAIQHLEGFAIGGSAVTFDMYIDERGADSDMAYFADKIAAYNTERVLLSQGRTRLIEAIERMVSSWTGESRIKADLLLGRLGEMDDAQFTEFVRSSKRMASDIKRFFESGYQRSSGEVEARNVEQRHEMTEEQRRNTPLSETEDVKRDDQRVRFSVEEDIFDMADRIGREEVMRRNKQKQQKGGRVRFSIGDFSERDRTLARDEYERMVSSGRYQFQEAVQDSMLGLKRLYQAILGRKKHIEDVPSNENAYLAENRMSSVNAAEQHEYFMKFMTPLLEAISKIAGKNAAARAELTDYMMAKHGLERNVVLAERDAREAEASGQDYVDAYNKCRNRDYSGLQALTGKYTVQEAEQEAKRMVDEYEQKHNTDELWEQVRKATGATLEKIYRSGLLSKERYNQIQAMFEYYIPLQGWDETTSDEVYGYLTSKNGPLTGGHIIKRAEGRSSKADDPIATIALMADTAIRQGNRNVMKQTFLNFVLNHPSDAVSVTPLWLQYNDVTNEWEPVFADIEPTDSPDEVEQKVEAFEARMEQLAESEPDKYKRGREASNIPYKVVNDNMREHQVLVKRNGATYVLTVNGNPRAAQALNGLTNPDVEQNGIIGNMLKLAQHINQNLSAFYTTRNPDFVISNFFRDMLYSNCMSWVREDWRYALRYHKNFGRVNPMYMRKLLAKYENGTLSDTNYIEKLFKQFMQNGGETGYTNVKDIEGHKRTISRELKKMNGNPAQRAWYWLGEQLDLLNRSVEGCARFAAFITSREVGRDIARSIYDAKEISVNFNKKGSGGKMVNATGQTTLGKFGSYVSGSGRLLYVFWNAGVQGSTNFLRGAKRHPVKALAGAASMFTLGAVIPILAEAMGGGDDDDKNAYYNLPEYIRRSNILINTGDSWIAIPLPIEFKAFYGLGELTYGTISGNERYTDSELALNMASQISQMLPLDMLEGGGVDFSPFIPSLAKPVVEAYMLNKSWSGLPIYKDTPYNKDDPEWTKAYKNANKYLVSVAKWLNQATGGDDFKKGAIDINPAKVEYLLSGVFGGWFSASDKLVKMGETAFGDREFDWKNMLLANRIIKTGDERTEARKLSNEYFKYKDKYEETKRLLKKYTDASLDDDFYQKRLEQLQKSDDYLQYEVFGSFDKMFSALKDAKDAASGEDFKKLEDEETALRREMVDMMHAIEDGKAKTFDKEIREIYDREYEKGGVTKQPASDLIAKSMGVEDSYAHNKETYNVEYTTKYREAFDRDEDLALAAAQAKAKEEGDQDRAKAIENARKKISLERGRLAPDGVPVSEEEAHEIMEDVRYVRRSYLDEFGISY